MIPNRDLVQGALVETCAALNRRGWGLPPIMCVLRANATGNGIVVEDMPSPPGFDKRIAAALFRVATLAAYPQAAADPATVKPIPDEVAAKYFTPDFAGLLIATEAWTRTDAQLPGETNWAHQPGSIEQRYLHAIDTTGYTYFLTHRRDNDEQHLATINPYGNGTDNDGHEIRDKSRVRYILQLLMAAIGQNHLKPGDHQIPPPPIHPIVYNGNEFDLPATIRLMYPGAV